MDVERFRQFALLVVVAIYILLLGGGAFIALHGIEPQGLQGLPGPSIAPPTPAPSIINTNPASIPIGKLSLLALLASVGIGLGLWAAVTTASLRARLIAATVSGASLLSCGPLSAYILRDLKFDSLLKFDQLAFTLNVNGTPADVKNVRLSAGAEYLGCVGYFPTGLAELASDPPAKPEERCSNENGSQLDRIKAGINRHEGPNDVVSVVLVGSADRQALRGKLRTMYDSNMGLARRRAEWVRKNLKTNIPALVLTTGPQKTEDSVNLVDLAKDRSVDVWVLWGNKDSAEKVPSKGK